jgi:hypothetical protein
MPAPKKLARKQKQKQKHKRGPAVETVQKKDKNDVKSKAAGSEAAASTMVSGADGAEQAGASVDKIRDILFGPQIKNYESRFVRLEDTLARESADLKETMRRRFESLEGFFKKETESLAARLKAERDERSELLKGLARDLKSSTDALTKKLVELDNKTAEGHSGLRQELMTESRKLVEEIRRRHDDLTALLERRAQELRHDKADRALLAALLTDVAMQLNEDVSQVRRGKPAKAANE